MSEINQATSYSGEYYARHMAKALDLQANVGPVDSSTVLLASRLRADIGFDDIARAIAIGNESFSDWIVITRSVDKKDFMGIYLSGSSKAIAANIREVESTARMSGFMNRMKNKVANAKLRYNISRAQSVAYDRAASGDDPNNNVGV